MATPSGDSRLPELPIDWDAVEAEAVELLQRYIRVDTTNPPGGEEAGALLLGEVLRKEGVTPTFYDPGGGRVSICARLPGTNSAGTKPLVLLSHIDVVPVERDCWIEDPYGGAVRDGAVWGRGALDMKGMGIMELLVFLLLKRHGVGHRRDILYLAVADEEEGSRWGMRWLAENVPELFEVDAVINEGAFGFGELMGVRGLVFGVATNEKAPLWLRLGYEGRPGHGSVPHRDNAAQHLVEALARVTSARQRLVLRPEVAATLAGLQRAGMLPSQLDFRDEGVLAAMAEGSDLVRALVSNTISLTSVASGSKQNVIPAQASATLDCRLLPGEPVETFLSGLRDLIADEGITVEVVNRIDPLVADVPTELLEHVEATLRHETQGGVLLPMMSPGFTDSRFYRERGVPAIGFVPVLLDDELLGTVHGHNERISIENLRLGTRLLLDTVRRVAGPA
jgi:acetylornithine deacetylase/succinyl-diaminopimelate desuccinylase-like protein